MNDQRAPIAVPQQLRTPEVRVEATSKVTGAAKYAGDFSRPGMLWAAFHRSERQHARIESVDVRAARALPGVQCVLTGGDIGELRFGRRLLDQPVLAVDRVRFVGERVAAVAAETRAAAEEAARAIAVRYVELPAIQDPEAALLPDAPVIHEDGESYAYLGGERPAVPHANVQGRFVVTKGEGSIEAAFRSSARVFQHRFLTPRQHHGYIEPHATLVWIDDDGIVHVISTNKTPFSLREQMSATLGLPPASLDIDSGWIGGDFGGKGYTPDEFACFLLARATGRPVKATMSYADELTASTTRHAAVIDLRTGVDADGRFVAHRARVLFDGGAYASAKPLPHLSLAGGAQTMAAYSIPNVSLEVLTVYTNTAPAGHMRGPGEVQALFAGESHVDAIARAMGRDSLEFRLLNAVRAGGTGPSGERHREPRAVDVLDALRHESRWGTPLAPGRGRGIAIGARRVGGGKTTLHLTFDRAGRVTVITGLPDQGSGAYTVIHRVATATLGVSPERVLVRRGTTAEAGVDAGFGASRVTHIASRAALLAAGKLKEGIEAAALRTLEPRGTVFRLVDDHLVSESGAHRVALAAAAPLLLEGTGGITVEETFEAVPVPGQPADFDFAGYVAEVDVDRETGRVSVQDVVLAVDVGTIINPVAHQGQLEGGFVFGLGAALMEELVVDAGVVRTTSLREYVLPTTMDVPELRTVLLTTDVGPGAFGAKMVGELTTAAVAPAISNAVADAVGVRSFSLPLSPERIHAALREAEASATRPDVP